MLCLLVCYVHVCDDVRELRWPYSGFGLNLNHHTSNRQLLCNHCFLRDSYQKCKLTLIPSSLSDCLPTPQLTIFQTSSIAYCLLAYSPYALLTCTENIVIMKVSAILIGTLTAAIVPHSIKGSEEVSFLRQKENVKEVTAKTVHEEVLGVSVDDVTEEKAILQDPSVGLEVGHNDIEVQEEEQVGVDMNCGGEKRICWKCEKAGGQKYRSKVYGCTGDWLDCCKDCKRDLERKGKIRTYAYCYDIYWGFHKDGIGLVYHPL